MYLETRKEGKLWEVYHIKTGAKANLGSFKTKKDALVCAAELEYLIDFAGYEAGAISFPDSGICEVSGVWSIPETMSRAKEIIKKCQYLLDERKPAKE